MPAIPSPEVQISLEINGQAWRQVGSLEDSGPRDRHFVVKIEQDGKAHLLFGDGVHGARPPSGARSMAVSYQPGSQYVGLILRQGRARHAESEERLGSLYRGVVTGNLDPENRLRLKVQVPEALGLEEVWAESCLPAGPASVPATGKHVWVMFEHGDPLYPVWIGTIRMPD